MNKPMTTYPKLKEGHESDHFQTPVYAVAPLVPYLPRGILWECACGDGNIVRALTPHCEEVIATDILTGYDFLQNPITHIFDCIVTNPPYSLKVEFTARCYEFGKPFALLMPITIEGNLCEMFHKHGAEFIVPFQRIRFITPKQRETGRDYYWRCASSDCREAFYTELEPEYCTECGREHGKFKRCTYSPQIKTIWVTHGLNIGRDVTYVDLIKHGYPNNIYA